MGRDKGRQQDWVTPAGRSVRRCRCAADPPPRTAGSSVLARWSSSCRWSRCPSAHAPLMSARLLSASLQDGRHEAVRSGLCHDTQAVVEPASHVDKQVKTKTELPDGGHSTAVMVRARGAQSAWATNLDHLLRVGALAGIDGGAVDVEEHLRQHRRPAHARCFLADKIALKTGPSVQRCCGRLFCVRILRMCSDAHLDHSMAVVRTRHRWACQSR